MKAYRIVDCIEGSVLVITPLEVGNIQERINIIREKIGAHWCEEDILSELMKGGNVYVVSEIEECPVAATGNLHLDPTAGISNDLSAEEAEAAAEAKKSRDATIALIRSQASSPTPLDLTKKADVKPTPLPIPGPTPLNVRKEGVLDKLRKALFK